MSAGGSRVEFAGRVRRGGGLELRQWLATHRAEDTAVGDQGQERVGDLAGGAGNTDGEDHKGGGRRYGSPFGADKERIVRFMKASHTGSEVRNWL